jgi:hypothetical protein
MPSNDEQSKPATWGLIFGLLTGAACAAPASTGPDHPPRTICGDTSGVTIEPCGGSNCTRYLGIGLPDGGVCVVPGSIGNSSSTVDGGPSAQQILCGFCNG